VKLRLFTPISRRGCTSFARRVGLKERRDEVS